MIIHTEKQGTSEWLRLRIDYRTASECPAMMNHSKYTTRDELIKQKATGVVKKPDEFTQAIFDKGHRLEAKARPIAEDIIGEKLFPVTGSRDKLLASFDGLTMMNDICWEHKTLNKLIGETESIADLHNMYKDQMEQQLYVSGAKKCLFMASNDEDSKYFWYESEPERRIAILNGWMQFDEDLKNYNPEDLILEADEDIEDMVFKLKDLTQRVKLLSDETYFFI